MKKLLTERPLIAAVLAFIAFFAAVIGLSMFLGDNLRGNYIKAAVVLLMIGGLYYLEGKDLTELGLSYKRLHLLLIGIVIGVIYFSLLFAIQMRRNDITIEFNKNLNWALFFSGFMYILGSVVIEELIFRGYSFKKTFEQIGIVKTNLIFASLYVIYHWFALNSWGNWEAMLGLITTGFGHLLFATAFTQSRTLFLPMGIHWGNNWAQRYFFSVKNMGVADANNLNDSLFSINVPDEEYSTMHDVGSYVVTLGYFLLFTYLIWKFYNRKKQSV
jgi:membrane protease YdiL (CAAX protease family)